MYCVDICSASQDFSFISINICFYSHLLLYMFLRSVMLAADESFIKRIWRWRCLSQI